MSSPLSDEQANTLAQRLKDDQLVLFAGAGLSRLAPKTNGSTERLPLWGELVERVSERFGIDPTELDNDPLQIFDYLIEEHSRPDLVAVVRAQLDDTDFGLSEAHHELSSLPWAAVITTNYDGLLARALRRPPIFDAAGCDRVDLRPPRLFQVHGTLDDPHTLSGQDYELWESRHVRLTHEIKDLLLKKTVLFVGYSNNDPHFKLSIAPWIKETLEARDKRFYAWEWQATNLRIRVQNNRHKTTVTQITSETDWAEAFSHIRSAYEKLDQSDNVAPSSSPSLTLPGYDAVQYRDSMQALYGPADLSGLYLGASGYPRDEIRLDELFVEPDVILAPEQSERRSEGFESDKHKRVPSGEDNDPLVTPFDSHSQSTLPARQEASSLIDLEKYLVITGLPGQGKSTLLRMRLLEGIGKWMTEDGPWPVYIRLRDWEGNGTGLVDWIRSDMLKQGEIGTPSIDRWFDGAVSWFLDGVDEIRDHNERQRLWTAILEISRSRPNDRVVVTSRPAGIGPGDVPAGWKSAAMTDLRDGQIVEVLSNWHDVLARFDGMNFVPSEVAERLKTNPGLARIRGNPLLLTLVVLFYKNRQQLPQDRWDFYDYAESTLRQSWASRRLRDAEAVLPSTAYMEPLLERLAIRGIHLGKTVFDRVEVAEVADQVLTDRNYRGAERDSEISKVMDAADDLIGVLVAIAPSRYSFLHLTFQEFLAARYLSKQTAAAGEFIVKYWDLPDWRETWDLYAHAIQDDDARVEMMVGEILSNKHKFDNQLFRPQRRCLQLMSEMTRLPRSNSVRRVIDWAADALNGNHGPLAQILILEKNTAPALLRSPTTRSLLLHLLVDDDPVIRWNVADALIASTTDTEVRAALLLQLEDDVSVVRWSALSALSDVVSNSEVKSKILLRLEDTDPIVRWTAVDALAKVSTDTEVMAALILRLEDDDSVVRWSTANALKEVASVPEVRAALLLCLEDDEIDVRFSVASVLRVTAADSEIEPAVLELLQNDVSSGGGETYVSAETIGTTADQKEALLSRINDQDETVRQGAVYALGEFAEDPEVRRVLLSCLDDDAGIVRISATEALRSVGADPEIITSLLRSLDDTNWMVRKGAVVALEQAIAEERRRQPK